MPVEEIRSFLTLLAEMFLVIALPVVIAAAFQYVRVLTRRYRDSLSETSQNTLDNAISIAVRVAEQTGVLEGLVGPEKRERAVEVATEYLKKYNIDIDVDMLADLVEAEVLTQFSNPTVPADTPTARQDLIDRAIEAAVLAAEQSGLKGHIKNIGEEKKAYAMSMVKHYLDAHGITIDDALISGLIEAELLRLVLAARGELPARS